ncbi:unnamed protein product [Leptosia nina]|uniref:VWFA domain-containing protein n=1 Tax=Leptosia nina TaxID=320188 RepID=A0AAV1JSH8_9NEOP
MACQILQLLNWRSRFYKTCTLPIFTMQKRVPILKEDIVPILEIHNKWVQKYLFEALYSLLNEPEMYEELNREVTKLKLNVEEEYTQISKISKKLRKCYGQSKLFKDQKEYDSCCARAKVYQDIHLDMNQPFDKQLYKMQHVLYTLNKMFAVDIPDEASIKNVENSVALAKESRNTLTSDMKLIPINVYLIQRMLNVVQPFLPDLLRKFFATEDILLHANETSCLDILSSVSNYAKSCLGFSSALLDHFQVLLEMRKDNQDATIERLSSLPMRLWDELYKVLTSSPAVHPSLFLSMSDPDDETVPANTTRFSTNLPLMAYYIQQLTTVIDEEGKKPVLAYEKVPLKDREEYSVQLQSLLNTLWNNIGTLDFAAKAKIKSDAQFELTKYEHLILYINSILVTQLNIPIIKLTHDKFALLRKSLKIAPHLMEILLKAEEIHKELKQKIKLNTKPAKIKILTAQLSLLTSVLFVQFMAEISPMDHVEKYRLKLQYIEEDVEMFNELLSAYYLHGAVSGTIVEYRDVYRLSQIAVDSLKGETLEDLKKVHPYCSVLMDLKKQTALSVHKYASGNTFRPVEPSYMSFVKECKHFTKSILSEKAIAMMSSNMVVTSNCLYQDIDSNIVSKPNMEKAKTVIREASTWLYSARAFYKKIETSYSEAFPDLAKPLQTSISQLIHSVTSLSDILKELIVKVERGSILPDLLRSLLVFPNKIPDRRAKEKHLNRFVTTHFMQLVNKDVDVCDLMKAEASCLQILKMNLSELYLQCTAAGYVDDTCARAVHTTLNALVTAWERQRQDMERKKQDEEALYVTKSKCEDEDDEAIAYEEIMEMFPSYADDDFAEFKPPTLEQRKIKLPTTDKVKPLITSEDVTLIYTWHSKFVRNSTLAEWLTSPKKIVGNDVVTPLLLRYPTFSKVVLDSWQALDADFEGEITPSLLVLLSHVKSQIDGTEDSAQKNQKDFYRSPWVAESRECLPILLEVKDTTAELLELWPDFPTLKDIMVIVNRILNFPITSPVSRFLTGLELLRDKIEEWNKNAHKGNNMIEQSLSVGQQIINWRKLEMSHWRECLNNLYQRKQSEAHKYWFYMYSVIQSYLDGSNSSDSEAPTAAKVTSVLRDFMEKSNVAEYAIRLDIVFVYHCHLVHMEQSQKRDELLSILWNTYNFYSQFSPQVAAFIKEKRAPIEKKLRDFVKICSWDRDLSYWSVKDTVDKAHKALHKHTKEFEKVLKENVSSCLVDNTTDVAVTHVGIWDRPKRSTMNTSAVSRGAYMIDPLVYVLHVRQFKKYMDQVALPCKILNEGSLLSKMPSLLSKAKQLCKDTITTCGYPSLVQGLDDFVTTVIETSTHLGSLEVDADATKQKQTSQAKNIVQQKRKALADLFKALAKMGLNYRTGLVILTALEDLCDFTIPPVDLDSAMSYLKSRRCDQTLSILWSGCEKYFQKNIARHRLLSNALQTPHSDLGMQNIERCKGFAAQLMQITNTQKKSIAKYSSYIVDLRIITTSLANVLELETDSANVSTISEKLDILADCYTKASILLDQFSILLKSLPESTFSSGAGPEFDKELSNSLLPHCYNGSDEWKELYKKVKYVIAIVERQNNTVTKLIAVPKRIRKSTFEIPSISQNHIDAVNDGIISLGLIRERINKILEEYKFELKHKVDDKSSLHPVLAGLVDFEHYVANTIRNIQALDKPNNKVKVLNENLKKDVLQVTEEVVANMLLIIQTLYKKHVSPDSKVDDLDETEESKEILEDNHLKELLQEKLSSDGKLLQLGCLINKLQNLCTLCIEYVTTEQGLEDVKSVIVRVMPLLEQLQLFAQYFVSQKVAVHRVSCKMLSILLKIFSDLATKGFCKPSDLDMEDGEGEGGPGKLSGGTGLGDGEGQKDVSERIENQDQLDDAHRPGEEKKEEERDCKEEEKGVNMTDDFDSHLQDVEQKEGDSDNENDNDDADKQMGDTDNAAEKLDQQIWGSEDEEDDEDKSKTEKKEERGAGEKTGEKEMGAKEQEEGQDDGGDGKEKQKKKDINEMDEPEVDDDQVDPHYGNHPEYPEPKDFEMPENTNADGDEGEEDKEGETETENPFDIDVMKENIQEEEPSKTEEKEENRTGLDVSSDEEDGAAEDGDTEKEQQEAEKEKEATSEDKPEEEEDSTNMDTESQPQPEPSQTETEPEEKQEDELPQNPDAMKEDDPVEEKEHEANPQANPSRDDPSAGERAENAEMDKGVNDNVETNPDQAMDEDAAPYEQAQEQVGEDKQSTGRSELDKSDKGHRGEKQAAKSDLSHKEQSRRENKPGKTDQERTLGDVNDKKHKQAQTLNQEREDAEEEGGEEGNDDSEADAFQHVKQAKKDDLQAVDSATKEQADQQPTLQKEEEEADKLKEDENLPMDVDDEDIQVEKSEESKPEKMKNGPEKDKEKSGNKNETGDEPTGDTGLEVEGDAVLTSTVSRGRDTTYHTRLEESSQQAEEISREQYISMRDWVQSGGVRSGVQSSAAWRAAWRDTATASRALCEKLRLVLEPTGRSRRAGDFRTGRAINMRRVIPYIASHFRKDRIWLRRTKPARREYHIAIAVDDSSSMADNRSKELAFESLALVSQALNLLESGDLAVLSFGEKPNLLHSFNEQFSEHSGSKILEQLCFEQTKTKIAQLLDFCTVMFDQQSVRSDAINAKLLVIVSDGRGIFSEGETRVLQAVRRARQQGIFLVYVIIDNPDNKDSIMDIRRPLLDPVTNALTGFIPYLDTFPFPFYLILRDLSALPTVLGDALRQWFELAANTST